ncbi:uncharacterized protein IL334_007176 [Kwoniella shivajii]|uniref:DNA endonuclease activator Ctp1 C-terminal domain-containing protein n=1 Tax=Kwoniella shivajii TaxID=564305 RepID=A0ABZ1DBY1_9TREE|nr:hypothetical protein IL334_007176 [Kwoniella shivajii]
MSGSVNPFAEAMRRGSEREESDNDESLGVELERQISQFNDMKSAIDQMTPLFTNLRNQCKNLKDRKETLENDVNTRTNEITKLNCEIQNLATEKEFLSNTAYLANNKDGTSSSSSSSQNLLQEGDVIGKLTRRNWLLEEQVRHVKQETIDMKRRCEEDIERERAISSGLRDRISDLDTRRKNLKDVKDRNDITIRELQSQIDIVQMEIRDIHEKANKDKDDLEDSLRKEKKELVKLKEELGGLRAEREAALAEVRKMKDDIAAQSIKSPPRILQPQNPNLPLSQISTQPMTPTKPVSCKPFTPLFTSPSSHAQAASPSSVARQHSHLQAAYTHLQKTHKSLKNQYDNLRKIHQEDIDHMKRYQASQIERKKKKEERKSKKKDERSLSNSQFGGEGSVLSSGTTVHNETKVGLVLVEESESVPKSRKKSNRSQQAEKHIVRKMGDEEEYMAYAEHDQSAEIEEGVWRVDPDMTSEELVKAINLFQLPQLVNHSRSNVDSSRNIPNSIPQAALATQITDGRQTETDTISQQQTRSSTRNAKAVERGDNAAPAVPQPQTSLSTPRPLPAQSKRFIQPAHVTPWLGITSGTPASSSKDRRKLGPTRSRVLDLNDEDDFASPPDETYTPTSAKTPLIRDRLGKTSAVGGGDSLRKMLMKHAYPQNEYHRTPAPLVGQRSGTSVELNASMAVQNTLSTPTGTSMRKRKIADLETGGLTPAEKATKLKKLAKMPASEKRELYASYKGKGRYVRPEEVNTSVREEFEIDPSANEGASFAFHDVKRKRSERKNMHGGDCECCRDYYDAVGEIPRYNQAPKWRDGPSVEKDEGEAVRDHQNMTSRHRETWIRPPTPPGFWKIGFPSTQEISEQNEQADQMQREKEERLRREVL